MLAKTGSDECPREVVIRKLKSEKSETKFVKFIYSGKATDLHHRYVLCSNCKIYKISTVDMFYVVTVKSTKFCGLLRMYEIYVSHLFCPNNFWLFLDIFRLIKSCQENIFFTRYTTF